MTNGFKKNSLQKIKGISIIESLVVLVIVGIGFIAINQMIAFSVSSMDRSMEKTKVNFLSESAVEDIMGDPNNASSYNFTEQCNKGSYSSSDLAGKKKDKWAKIFRAEDQITLDNKKRVINCQSGDEKKALIGNSKNSGTQAMFNFKTGKGKKNKFIGVVVK